MFSYAPILPLIQLNETTTKMKTLIFTVIMIDTAQKCQFKFQFGFKVCAILIARGKATKTKFVCDQKYL